MKGTVMTSITEYFIFWSLVFCAGGILVYILDFWGGQGIRKWWYDMTHKDPSLETEAQGFIHRRSFRTRLRTAVLMGVVGSIIVSIKTEFRPIAELFLWIACVPAVFAGLLLGPFVCRLWQNREKAIHALEEAEKHGINIKGGMQTALHHVGESLHAAIEHVHPTPIEPIKPPSSPEPKPSEPTKEELRAMMNKYTG